MRCRAPHDLVWRVVRWVLRWDRNMSPLEGRVTVSFLFWPSWSLLSYFAEIFITKSTLFVEIQTAWISTGFVELVWISVASDGVRKFWLWMALDRSLPVWFNAVSIVSVLKRVFCSIELHQFLTCDLLSSRLVYIVYMAGTPNSIFRQFSEISFPRDPVSFCELLLIIVYFSIL